MKISVIGTGYVGLVTGSCLAHLGHEVVCVDIDEKKINLLNDGKVPIYEPGLKEVIDPLRKSKALSFTTDLKVGVAHGAVIFLALPTPPDEDGSADLSYVINCASDIGTILTDYKVIVNKSTVPVGTAQLVIDALRKQTEVAFDVVSNPEFLREGSAVDDFLNPDRIVIGTDSEKADALMREVYQPLINKGVKFIVGDTKSSEMTKYAANAYLAARITYMNEIANMCDRVGANVDFVQQGIGSDSRIGPKFLQAGIGFGGSCFPKDIMALVKKAEENQYNFKILNSVIEVNETQKVVLVTKIKNYFKGNLQNKRIGVWGLSFKPDTDDIRMASSLKIIDALLSKGAKIKAYDPVAMENVRRRSGDKIEYADSAEACVQDVDALVIATEWKEFKGFNLEKLKSLMSSPVIFDGRNIFDLIRMKKLGFYYESIGRPVIK